MKFTKFIKITTNHTKKELQSLLDSLSYREVQELKKVYYKFNFVEFQQDEFVCMYAAIHQNYIKNLLDIYINLNISFKYEDLTKEALFNLIELDTPEIDELVQNFIKQNIEVDDVLDKINELGMSSLTPIDLAVLENV